MSSATRACGWVPGEVPASPRGVSACLAPRQIPWGYVIVPRGYVPLSPRCVPGCLMRRRCVCQAPRGVSLSPGAVLMAIATVPAPTGLRLHAVGCAAFPQVHQLRVRGPQGTCSGRLQVPRTECCGEIRKWCWGGRTVLCLVRASSPGPHPSDPSSSARCSRVPRAPHTGIQTRVQTLLLHRDQGTGGCTIRTQ